MKRLELEVLQLLKTPSLEMKRNNSAQQQTFASTDSIREQLFRAFHYATIQSVPARAARRLSLLDHLHTASHTHTYTTFRAADSDEFDLVLWASRFRVRHRLAR